MAQRLSAIRGYARYLVDSDLVAEVPPLGLLSVKARPARPYLYSEAEISGLLKAAKAYPSWNRFPNCGWNNFQAWTLYCIFVLLAVTGMRVGEVLNLRATDIGWTEGVLTIHHAKFGKSRLIPLHASTLKALATFVKHRNYFFSHLHPQPELSHFFVTSRGTRLHVTHINTIFLRLSRQIGLRAPEAHHGPRLHDLRHRFAIETLLRWYRSGESVDRLLPVLSIYLGHTHVSGTYWYLRCTPELMGAAASRLERRWKGVR
jgi:integrase